MSCVHYFSLKNTAISKSFIVKCFSWNEWTSNTCTYVSPPLKTNVIDGKMDRTSDAGRGGGKDGMQHWTPFPMFEQRKKETSYILYYTFKIFLFMLQSWRKILSSIIKYICFNVTSLAENNFVNRYFQGHDSFPPLSIWDLLSEVETGRGGHRAEPTLQTERKVHLDGWRCVVDRRW